MVANIRHNLNRLVRWQEVLTLLRLPEIPPALPASVHCLFCCEGRLQLWPDQAYGGQWAHCPDCGFAGDLVQLTAAAEKLPLDAALRRLADAFPELRSAFASGTAASRYQQDWTGRRIAAATFWREASARFRDNAPLRQLRLRLNATEHLADDGHLGAATLDEVRTLRCTDEPPQKAETCAILPFYDLPGRIAAFLCYVHPLAEADPQVVDYVSVIAQRDPPAGLALTQGLQAPGDELLLLVDPLLALRLQRRHQRTQTGLLPLAAIWPAAPVSAWLRFAARRPVVVWGPQANYDLFRHARAVGGRITASALPNPSLSQRYLPTWGNLCRAGRPWEEALETHLTSLAPAEAEDLLFRLDWPAGTLEAFIENCAASLRRRLRQSCANRHRTRQTLTNGKCVEETEQGWQLPRGEIITDAALRVERIIRWTDGACAYCGHIRYKGEAIPFRASAADLKKKPLAWVQRKLLQEGRGFATYNPKWEAHALTVAARFHPPKIEQGIERCGWDADRGLFVTPSHLIEAGGRVTPHDLLPAAMVATMPAPQPLTPEERTKLDSWTKEIRLVWTIAAFIVHNVCAPLFRRKPVGLLVARRRNECVEAASDLATAAGCMRASPGSDEVQPPSVGGWPSVFDLHNLSPADRLRQLRLSPGSRMLCLRWYASRACLVRGGWLCFDAWGFPVRLSPDAAPLAGRIVGAYLLALAERNFSPWVDERPDRFRHTVNSLQAWYGPTRAVRNALRSAWCDIEASGASAFCSLLRALVKTSCALRFDDGGARTATCLVHMPNDQLWIPQRGFNRALAAVGAPPLSADCVSRALAAAGLLRGERLDQQRRGSRLEFGWVVPAAVLERPKGLYPAKESAARLLVS